MAQEDDAKVAQRARQARELEKEVVDKIRKDGTFDAFRRRIIEEVGQKARGRGVFFTFGHSIDNKAEKRPRCLFQESHTCGSLY